MNIAADLDDSIFSLAISIVSLLNHTSILATRAMEEWFKQIVLEVDDIAVTKHAKHIEKLTELLTHMKNYADSFNYVFSPLIEQHILHDDGEDEDAADVPGALGSFEMQMKPFSSPGGNNSPPTVPSPVMLSKSSPPGALVKGGPPGMGMGGRQGSMRRMKSIV